jgi:hypothetical protein
MWNSVGWHTLSHLFQEPATFFRNRMEMACNALFLLRDESEHIKINHGLALLAAARDSLTSFIPTM